MVLVLLWSAWAASCWHVGAGDRASPASAVCGPESCYTVHLGRRSFSEAWRACRDSGGNLASIRKRQDARLVEELLEGLPGGRGHGPLKLWLGLQRQPRQCAPHKALRGFTWMTGDQDTAYSNWLREEAPSSCPASRCVVVSYSGPSGHSNHKWLDGSCHLAVDGYLCRFSSPRGMCRGLGPGPDGRLPFYTTPFGVTAPGLQHVPFGSVATLRCPEGAQSLLCMAREEGSHAPGAGGGVTWSREPPFCQEERPSGWCGEGNGGCQHTCLDEGSFYHCQCHEGYQLGEDGRSCTPLEACLGGLDGEGRCLVVGECQGVECAGVQLCTGPRGSEPCGCPEGHKLEAGECVDVDECQAHPCAQLCANAPGSYLCYCRAGFTLSEEDEASCLDVDECQYQGTCQQICINYQGAYECHCEEGYSLDPDGFSCRPLRPRVPHPRRDPGTVPAAAPRERRPGSATSGLRPTSPGQQQEEEEKDKPLPRARDPPRVTSTLEVTPRTPGNSRPPWTPNYPPETRGSASSPAKIPSYPPETRSSASSPAKTPNYPPETRSSASSPAKIPSYLPETRGSASSPAKIPNYPPETRGSASSPAKIPSYPSETRGSVSSPAEIPSYPPETRDSASIPTGNPRYPPEPWGALVDASSPTRAYRRLPEMRGAQVDTGHPARTDSYPPETRALLPNVPIQSRPVPAAGEGAEVNGSGAAGAHRELRGRRDDCWLLVALLVPACVFLVVMLALGIVYCTRCACGKKQNVTNCYRWANQTNAKVPCHDPSAHATMLEPPSPGQPTSLWRTDVTHL